MKRNIFPIEVGQTVFLTPQGNVARGWDKVEPFEGTIDSIARKYFFVKQKGFVSRTEKFEKETFRCRHEDENSSYILWESKEAWYNFRDAVKELEAIRSFVSYQSSAFLRNECGAEQVIHDMYRVLADAGLTKLR